MFKKNRLIKILAWGVTLWHFIAYSILPISVYAQELGFETASGSAIVTGDAVAVSEIDNEANVFVTGVGETGQAEESTPSGEPEDDSSLLVESTQSALQESENQSSAESGHNTASGSGEIDLSTGDALAIANTVNVANVNLVGSEVVFLNESIVNSETGEINLYQLLGEADSNLPSDTVVLVDQEASVDSENTASASSGVNNLLGGSGNLITGDAVAVANTINLTNLNFVGSRMVVFVVNILGSLKGNIILPNLVAYGGPLPEKLYVETNQTAEVNADTQAGASTGENTLEGGGNLSTGNATAMSDSYVLTNLVKIGENWGFLLINYLGDWQGSLQNWQQPGSSEQFDKGLITLEKDQEAQGVASGSSLTVITNQDAEVNSMTSAGANTGTNNLQGSGELITGEAAAIANSLNLTNFVGVGGSFFFGVINVVGNWLGDLIVAYPDLMVGISDGQETILPGAAVNYSIVVTNDGEAKVSQGEVSYSLPQDFVGEREGTIGFDALSPHESVSFTISGQISPTALAGTQLLAEVWVTTSEEEVTQDNNSASDITEVVLPTGLGGGEADGRTPSLAVTVWNNVAEFVYPSDTVRAKIVVANQSPFVARDVIVNGQLSNDHPMPAIPMVWKLGDLAPGQRVTIEFEIGLIDALPAGIYHLSASANGKSQSGETAGSGWVVSNFLIKLKYLAGNLATEAVAEDGNGSQQVGEVLGASEVRKGFDIREYFPYILPISILTLFIISFLKKNLETLPNE